MPKRGYSVVGRSIERLDAYEKATGQARYTVDHTEVGMLYVRVLRSPHPHARIVSINTEAAEAMMGVACVLSYCNTSEKTFNWSDATVTTDDDSSVVRDMRLFEQELRYVGDEVAAVAAMTEEIAQAAIDAIEVTYELLPSVLDARSSLAPGAPLLHPEYRPLSNKLGETKKSVGDIQEGFKRCRTIVEGTYKLPVQKQMQLETQNAMAVFSGDGKLTVWSPTQSPALAQRLLSAICDVPMCKLRVVNPGYVGGAFGVRIGLSSKAELICVEMAKRTRKPVKYVYDRRGDCIASETRHSGEIYIKLGADKEGNILALQAEGLWNTGAYALSSQGVTACASGHVLAQYHIPNMEYSMASVYTNYTPAGAMRGYAAPQPTFALEMAVNKLAEAIGMDPRELREKNLMQPGEPWVQPYPLRTTGAKECIRVGSEKIGWDEFFASPQAQEGRFRRGMGMACGNHISSGAPFSTEHSNVYMAMHYDGTFQFAVGIMEMGTGLKTTLVQIAAEELHTGVENISITIGDTEIPLADCGDQASRGTYATGSAVKRAASNLMAQMLEYIGEQKGMDAGTLLAEDSKVYDSEGNLIFTYPQLARDADNHNRQFIATGQNMTDNALSWNAHFADVTVDTHTGAVKVNRYVAVHEAGCAINPDMLKSSIEGGVSMGIGYALQEQIGYTSSGKQIHDSFHKYMIPVASDFGEIQAEYVEEVEPTGPYGAKGVGESSVAPCAPAIAAAVHCAVGVWFDELPITPERVLLKLHGMDTK